MTTANEPSSANDIKRKLAPVSPSLKVEVADASPARYRCNIENRGFLDKPFVGIDLCNIFDRNHTLNEDLMTSIEYSWGLKRGELCLNAVQNNLFVGSEFQLMHKAGVWGLVPKLETLIKYSMATAEDDCQHGHNLKRAMEQDDLKIEEETAKQRVHTYTFLALDSAMEYRPIFLYHQRESEVLPKGDKLEEVTRYYPFDEPWVEIKSHLHPKFVILGLGQELIACNAGAMEHRQSGHMKKFSKELALVVDLYRRWTTNLSTQQDSDPAFGIFVPTSPAVPAEEGVNTPRATALQAQLECDESDDDESESGSDIDWQESESGSEWEDDQGESGSDSDEDSDESESGSDNDLENYDDESVSESDGE
ncbi:hypothetical protein BJ165DRAFT_1408271 [Panaeolus papilionaceus]|nr:hypothetical protein BJ165DRAFT_1408271 [Panaeolus papilionaceus]